MDHIKQFYASLEQTLQKKSVLAANIDLFVQDFAKGVETNWEVQANDLPSREKLLNFADFQKKLQGFEVTTNQVNKELKFILAAVLADCSRLSARSSQVRNLDVLPNYDYEELLTQLDRYQAFLRNSIEDLNLVIRKGPLPDFRRSFYALKVYGMSHCLFGLTGTASNSDTVFNQLLGHCFDYARLATSERKSHLLPLFTDSSYAYELAYVYKHYDRLDLYKEYLKETSFEAEILTNFANGGAWQNW